MPSPFQFISFAGVSLSCSTPGLEDRINTLLPLAQWRDWDAWNFASAGTDLGNLPTPSLPQAPPLRLGVLHWPNDATRPAWFHAAVTKPILDAINEVYTTPAEPQDLILQDGRPDKIISAKMSMLPPRPISQLGIDSDGWLLTFTDQRFWWQWRSGSIDTAPESWEELFSTLTTLLGIPCIDVEEIDEAYGTPTTKWIGYLRPPATVLDTVAASVGQRIVVDLDGTVRSVNWETAKEAATTQSEALTVVMGGAVSSEEIGKYVPAAVNVADNSTIPHTSEKTLEELAIEEYGSATGVDGAVSTVFVDFNYTTDEYPAWSALVEAAAIDWYGWRLSDLDVAFPGVAEWTPTGFEDFVEWIVKLTDPWIDTRNPHEPLIATIVRRPPWSNFPSTILPKSMTNPVIVRLIDEGEGIDGGTAWSARLMHEVAGNVVTSSEWLGGVEEEPYILYATDEAYDGRDGLPEEDDLVDAFPDPHTPGRWLFVPKSANPVGCNDCSWLADLPDDVCLLYEQLGGDGRCGCVPVSAETPMVRTSVSGTEGWLGIRMGKSCCGCGGLIFQATTGSEDYDAVLQMHRYHVACGGSGGAYTGGLFTKNLKLECCGIDVLGRRFAVFTGWGEEACDGEPEGCDNAFRIRITCGECPEPECTCSLCSQCCSGETPLGYFFDFSGFPDGRMNGLWILAPDPDEDCVWSAECYGYSSTLSTYENESEETVWKLDHNGAIYELTAWSCCDVNLMSKISGDGPSTIGLFPITNGDACSPCEPTWPDEVCITITEIELTGGAFSDFDVGQQFTLTKVVPTPPQEWSPALGWQLNNFPPTDPIMNFFCEDAIGSRGFSASGTDSLGQASFAVNFFSGEGYSSTCPLNGESLFMTGTSTEVCASSPSCSYGPPGATVFIRIEVTGGPCA